MKMSILFSWWEAFQKVLISNQKFLKNSKKVKFKFLFQEDLKSQLLGVPVFMG